MTETDFQRRQALKILSALGVGLPAATLFGSRVYAATDRTVLFSARTDSSGRHLCVAYQLNGQEVFTTPIPLRAHDIVPHPDGSEVLFVARRPGTQCYWLDSHNGKMISVLEARKDRHFYGHGVFDSAGNYLYLTENDTKDPGRGVLAVYRYKNGKLVFETELSTQGIGPHQLLWLPDTQTLAIANGGLRTEADSRQDLNIDAMESSLVILRPDGTLLSKETLPEQHSSIRHLALCGDGTLVSAQQYMGDAEDSSTLLAIKRPGQALLPFPLDELQQRNMNQYCASIAAHPTLGLIAVTAPRGNRLLVWNVHSNQNVLDMHFPDCAGLAVTQEGFVASSGQSRCLRLHYSGGEIKTEMLSLPSGGWDNHLRLTNIFSS